MVLMEREESYRLDLSREYIILGTIIIGPLFIYNKSHNQQIYKLPYLLHSLDLIFR